MQAPTERTQADELVRLELVEITPELAATWLANAHPNRPINPRRVAMLAAAIEAGEWRVNGETIKFDGNGQMNDGQQRLTAVIQTGRPIVSYVLHGLPADSFDTLDIGKARTPADLLSSLGYGQGLALAAALRHVRVLDYLVESGTYQRSPFMRGAPKVWLTPAKARTMIAERPDLPTWVATARKLRLAGIPGGDGFWAGLLSWFSTSLHAAQDDAQGLADDLISGAGLEAGNPILALRNRLISSRESRRGRPQIDEMTAWIIKGWNAFRRGEKLSVVKWSRGGRNREDFPIPV